MALAYLIDPQLQFSDKSGALNVAGFLRVYLNGTDDRATTYSDFNGTLNTADIVLDNNGRAVVIADSSKAYRLEVYTRYGDLLWTQYPLNTLVGGAGGASGVVVESSDGTVDVTKYNDGGIVHYDLSTQVTDEASQWGGVIMRGTGVEGDMMWHRVPVDSSLGSVGYSQGWHVTKECIADIAASVEFSADNNDALNTVDVQCEFLVDGSVDRVEGGLLDPTQPKGRVSFEYKGSVSEGQVIDCRIYVRCPQTLTLALRGYAVYNEEVDGVVGNGGEGGAEYIAGEYVEITPGNVINVTGLQPSGNYVTDNTFTSYTATALSGVEAEIADIQSSITGLTGTYVEQSSFTSYTAAADSSYVHTGDMSGYATTSQLSEKMDESASSNFYSTSNPSGFITGVDLSPYAESSSLSAYQEKSAMSGYATKGDLNGKLDSSASSSFYSTSNPSGFITGVDLSPYAQSSSLSAYQEKSAMSGYATTSDLSTKLDSSASSAFVTSTSNLMPLSASSDFYSTSNPSGFITGVDLSPYAESSSLSAYQQTSGMSAYQTTADMTAYMPITATAGMFTGVQTDNTLTGNGLSGSALGVNARELQFSSPLYTSLSGNTAYVNLDSAFMSGYQTVSAMSAYATTGALAEKLDASASSSFIPASASGDFVPYSSVNIVEV